MNLKRKRLLSVATLVLLLGACTTIPDGPSVMVLPGSGKTFPMFQADDAECQQFALNRIGKSPDRLAVESGVKTAALTAAMGALAGAAIDGSGGAAVGAGIGAAIGGLTGASSSSGTGDMAQRRFDNAYMQCMFAKGNRIPVRGGFTETGAQQSVQPTLQQPAYPPKNTPVPPPAEAIVPEGTN